MAVRFYKISCQSCFYSCSILSYHGYYAPGKYLKSQPKTSDEISSPGFHQRLGKDYFGTFAPMANFTNVRLIIALAVCYGWGLFHADIPQAFLRSVCDAPIYIQLVRGVNLRSKADGTDPLQHDMALRLLKSLYGIKQAPQLWNKDITNFMVNESFGFTRASAESSLYYKHDQNTGDIIAFCAYWKSTISLLRATTTRLSRNSS